MTLFANAQMRQAREGMIAYSPERSVIRSFDAEDAIRVGLLVERGTLERQVRAVQALPGVVANSITATPLASNVAAQDLGPAALDGVLYGNGQLIGLAQRIRLTFNASGDWLASAISLRLEGPGGHEVTEDVFVPAGGDVVLDTHGAYSMLKGVAIPPQGGAGGTLTIGTAPTVYVPDPRHFIGVPVYNRTMYPSATATVSHDANQPVSVMVKGAVWVAVEAAVAAGDPAYVRFVTVGGNVRGQFRGTPAANFARLPGATFLSDQGTAGGLAIVEIGG